MRYQKAIHFTAARELVGLHAGQWVIMDGVQLGRFMGFKNGTVWIAWAGTAKKRFKKFAEAYRAA